MLLFSASPPSPPHNLLQTPTVGRSDDRDRSETAAASDDADDGGRLAPPVVGRARAGSGATAASERLSVALLRNQDPSVSIFGLDQHPQVPNGGESGTEDSAAATLRAEAAAAALAEAAATDVFGGPRGGRDVHTAPVGHGGSNPGVRMEASIFAGAGANAMPIAEVRRVVSACLWL